MNPKPTNQQKREAYYDELDVLTTELEERVKRFRLMVNGLKDSL